MILCQESRHVSEQAAFFATLIVVIALAAVRRLDVDVNEFGVLTPNSLPSHPAVAHDEPLGYTGQRAYELVRLNWASPAISETPSNIFLLLQSQDPADLSAGKLLVASRALADPNFAETVVLLVHCDAQGVVGLILNRRTDVPLSRVLEQFAGSERPFRPGLSRWSRRNSGGVWFAAVDGQA